jgi:hypothetical protein
MVLVDWKKNSASPAPRLDAATTWKKFNPAKFVVAGRAFN